MAPPAGDILSAMLRRRAFGIAGAAAAPSLIAETRANLKIGVMDTVFRLAGNPEAVPLAKRLGLAAVQVTLGRSADGRTLPLEDSAAQQKWTQASSDYGVPLDSTYLDQLHVDCLKSSSQAPMWIRKGIQITKNLNARVLMTVFFGKCQVLERKELDYVLDQSAEILPEAERAGIIIGFENTSSGADNRYAVDKLASDFFKVWYDVGNSTYNNYDVPKEIRMLGRDRICRFHFKDRGYLGEGQVNFPAILSAINDIGFTGYANLETTSPSGNVEADTKRNLAYLQRLMS
jgi:sugar phosphate isomerase/epimerase